VRKCLCRCFSDVSAFLLTVIIDGLRDLAFDRICEKLLGVRHFLFSPFSYIVHTGCGVLFQQLLVYVCNYYPAVDCL